MQPAASPLSPLPSNPRRAETPFSPAQQVSSGLCARNICPTNVEYIDRGISRDQEGAEVLFRNHILGTGKRVSGQGACR